VIRRARAERSRKRCGAEPRGLRRLRSDGGPVRDPPRSRLRRPRLGRGDGSFTYVPREPPRPVTELPFIRWSPTGFARRSPGPPSPARGLAPHRGPAKHADRRADGIGQDAGRVSVGAQHLCERASAGPSRIASTSSTSLAKGARQRHREDSPPLCSGSRARRASRPQARRHPHRVRTGDTPAKDRNFSCATPRTS